jgi:RNA polymerase sigma-70 factor (ECF subfamily)
LRNRLARQLARYGASTSEVEDVVQEVLLAIHLKRHTWDTARPIGPWLTAIAHHKLIDQLRRRGVRHAVPIEDVADTLHCAEAPPGTAHLDAARMLTKLNGRQRKVVQSLSIDGATVRETAEDLGMTEGAVRVTFYRGLRTLAALFRSPVP